MDPDAYRIGQRLSLKGQLLTIRYVGAVAEKAGEWLGVEWDDPSRGKHHGTHDGVKYFECRSSSPTAASFLRPSQPWDRSRTFLQALREKYVPEEDESKPETVYFSTKQAEEVGFHKFAQRQAQLQGIHVLVLDRMRIRYRSSDGEGETIESVCANITDLDIGGNLFEDLEEILHLCKHLRRLRRLTLDSNRFAVSSLDRRMQNVDYLGLSNTLLSMNDIFLATAAFPGVSQLAATNNGLLSFGHINPAWIPANLQHFDLTENEFVALPNPTELLEFSHLSILSLKRNAIRRLQDESLPRENPSLVASNVAELDLSYNTISAWSFFDALSGVYPAVKSLRVTGNPLYSDLKSADGKPLTSDDGYMLTIARLPQIRTLNYSKIAEKERLNAETYYLGQIAIESSQVSPDRVAGVFARHPRWKSLCEEYGEPTIQRSSGQDVMDPNSLAARLVAVTFSLSSTSLPDAQVRSWQEEIPKSFNMYCVLGIVGKRLGVMPLKLRLIWETGEQDPAGGDGGYSGPEWWDSDDEESDRPAASDLVAREVELAAGKRSLGTYIEGREAKVRVELLDE